MLSIIVSHILSSSVLVYDRKLYAQAESTYVVLQSRLMQGKSYARNASLEMRYGRMIEGIFCASEPQAIPKDLRHWASVLTKDQIRNASHLPWIPVLPCDLDLLVSVERGFTTFRAGRFGLKNTAFSSAHLCRPRSSRMASFARNPALATMSKYLLIDQFSTKIIANVHKTKKCTTLIASHLALPQRTSHPRSNELEKRLLYGIATGIHQHSGY